MALRHNNPNHKGGEAAASNISDGYGALHARADDAVPASDEETVSIFTISDDKWVSPDLLDEYAKCTEVTVQQQGSSLGEAHTSTRGNPSGLNPTVAPLKHQQAVSRRRY